MTQLGREKRTRRGGDWNKPVSQDAGWPSLMAPLSAAIQLDAASYSWHKWWMWSENYRVEYALQCKAGGLVHCRHKDRWWCYEEIWLLLCLWFVICAINPFPMVQMMIANRIVESPYGRKCYHCRYRHATQRHQATDGSTWQHMRMIIVKISTSFTSGSSVEEEENLEL